MQALTHLAFLPPLPSTPPSSAGNSGSSGGGVSSSTVCCSSPSASFTQQSKVGHVCKLSAALHHGRASSPSSSFSGPYHSSPSVAQTRKNCIRAATGESASTSTVEPLPSSSKVGVQRADDRVTHITTVQQFDEALVAAKKKLVVVEYASSTSVNSRRIYPSMVDLSKTLKGVVFLLVLGDESDATKELCERAGVENVPHFVFYKNSEKIHEEKGITSDVLEGDVLYYGDNDAPIYHVHNQEDFDILLKDHASDHKLVVLDVGLKSCGPCAKIYPTFVKLAKRMADTCVFARMHGDENEECVGLLKSMGVVEVPTFLFMRDGKPLGRYVGSGRGELVGEILRHSGVRVT